MDGSRLGLATDRPVEPLRAEWQIASVLAFLAFPRELRVVSLGRALTALMLILAWSGGSLHAQLEVLGWWVAHTHHSEHTHAHDGNAAHDHGAHHDEDGDTSEAHGDHEDYVARDLRSKNEIRSDSGTRSDLAPARPALFLSIAALLAPVPPTAIFPAIGPPPHPPDSLPASILLGCVADAIAPPLTA